MNKLYAIVGPHASGKSEILNKLRTIGIPCLISHTTRKPRKGETDFYDYYFVSPETFKTLSFAEKVMYQGEHYGISKNELIEKMKTSKILVTLVEQNGLIQLKKLLGSRLESIYIMVDYVTMVERMLMNNETDAEIKRQLEFCEKNGEFDIWKKTTHIVKNTGNINIAVNQILAIMELLVPK